MSTSPSIPTPPPPGKDPPPSKPTTPPQLNPPTPPTSQSTTSPPQTKTSRPSPLRQTTSSSLLPTLHPISTGPSTLHPPTLSTHEDAEPTRPPFTPFFTLIHDPSTDTTHHPSRIHYLFSDDDDTSDLLSSACIRSLNPPSLSRSSSPGKAVSSSTSSSSSSSALRKSRDGANLRDKDGREKGLDEEREKEKEKREERVIIIDINAPGTSITSANSLSATWQILSATLSSAPTFDGGSEGQDEDAERGLMLRVEGVGVDRSDSGDGLGMERRGSAVLGDEEMQGLLEGFDRKMAVLRKIVGEGWGGIAVDAGSGEEKEDEG